MNDTTVETAIEIFGKVYQIKCSETEMLSLKSAAQILEEKILALRKKNPAVAHDRLAIIIALNVIHEMLGMESRKEDQMQDVHQRLQDLQNKIDLALHV